MGSGGGGIQQQDGGINQQGTAADGAPTSPVALAAHMLSRWEEIGAVLSRGDNVWAFDVDVVMLDVPPLAETMATEGGACNVLYQRPPPQMLAGTAANIGDVGDGSHFRGGSSGQMFLRAKDEVSRVLVAAMAAEQRQGQQQQGDHGLAAAAAAAGRTRFGDSDSAGLFEGIPDLKVCFLPDVYSSSCWGMPYDAVTLHADCVSDTDATAAAATAAPDTLVSQKLKVLHQAMDDHSRYRKDAGASHVGSREQEEHVINFEKEGYACSNLKLLMSRVDKDVMPVLAHWPSGILPRAQMNEWASKVLNRTHERAFDNQMFVHHVLIKDHKVYISHLHDYWANFMIPVILDILDAAPYVPDVEFFLNLGDAPRSMEDEALKNHRTAVPLLSYQKFKDHLREHSSLDIMSPCYYAWMVDKVCAEQNSFSPFANRKSTVFGAYGAHCPQMAPGKDRRGNNLHECPRAYFKNLANQHPTEMEIHLSSVKNMEQYNITNSDEPVKLREHGDFKYLLETDGIGRSCRFEILLAMGAVVLKPTSSYTTYFEDALVPFYHYVPVWRESPDDLLEIRRWLEMHPKKAEQIARAGQDFACTQLTKLPRRCYWTSLLSKFAGMLESIPSKEERSWLQEVDDTNVVCDVSLDEVEAEGSFGGCRIDFKKGPAD